MVSSALTQFPVILPETLTARRSVPTTGLAREGRPVVQRRPSGWLRASRWARPVLPDPWERWTGRVIPFDEQGRALLMHGHEPHRPEQPYWFSIGGAVEGDEDARRAASRELFEETGVRLSPEELHGPVLDETVEFSCAGVRVVQHQEVFTCRLTSSIALTLDGLEPAEMATVDAAQWVSLGLLEASGPQIEGADLTDYGRRCLAHLARRD